MWKFKDVSFGRIKGSALREKAEGVKHPEYGVAELDSMMWGSLLARTGWWDMIATEFTWPGKGLWEDWSINTWLEHLDVGLGRVDNAREFGEGAKKIQEILSTAKCPDQRCRDRVAKVHGRQHLVKAHLVCLGSCFRKYSWRRAKYVLAAADIAANNLYFDLMAVTIDLSTWLKAFAYDQQCVISSLRRAKPGCRFICILMLRQFSTSRSMAHTYKVK